MRTHLLVAIDQGEASRVAVRVAGLIARALKSRVTILYVDHPGLREDANSPERLAQQELARLGIKAEVSARGGDPVDEIVAAARGLKCTLLVMGSRGRSSLAGLLLGSVSQEVVARASCPVLLVRAEADASRAPHSILLAIEGLEGSQSLVAITARLAKALPARVTVVHVSYPGGEELERSLYHARQTHGEEAVAAAASALDKKGISTESMRVIARSGIARSLTKCAETIGADLIVMGSHSPDQPGEQARAEVSTAVSHRTKRPVLVTRE